MLLSLLLTTALAAGAPYTATITAVPEPDVLHVRLGAEERSVRLFGVDAPEPGQPRHEDALKLVRDLTLNKTATITPRAKDTAGIEVAEIALEDGAQPHKRLLEAGLAWWDKVNAPAATDLRHLNAIAILAGDGLWADPAPLAPWDYRKSHGGADITYQPAARATPAPEPEKEELVPTIKAKGATPAPVQAVTPEMVKQVENLDPMMLALTHQPTFARDANGNVLGLTALNISQIPLATVLGFRDGDIIRSVNGIILQNEAQLFTIYPQLEDSKRFEVELLRNGAPTHLTITLP